MVEVSITDLTGLQRARRILQVLDLATVYKQIDEHETLNLEGCYIKDFSLSLYRQDRGLAETDLVELRDLNAQGAYFDIEKGVDFVHAKFTGQTASDLLQ